MSHSRYLDRPRRSYEEAMGAKQARDGALDVSGNGSDERGRAGTFLNFKKK